MKQSMYLLSAIKCPSHSIDYISWHIQTNPNISMYNLHIFTFALQWNDIVSFTTLPFNKVHFKQLYTDMTSLKFCTDVKVSDGNSGGRAV